MIPDENNLSATKIMDMELAKQQELEEEELLLKGISPKDGVPIGEAGDSYGDAYADMEKLYESDGQAQVDYDDDEDIKSQTKDKTIDDDFEL